MTNNASTISKISFSTERGENIVAIKKGNKVIINGDKYGKRVVSPTELLQMLSNSNPPLERSPQTDIYRPRSRKSRDRELIRTIIYSNPLVNPFGCVTTRDGVEPLIKNPLIEGAINSIYGKD